MDLDGYPSYEGNSRVDGTGGCYPRQVAGMNVLLQVSAPSLLTLLALRANQSVLATRIFNGEPRPLVKIRYPSIQNSVLPGVWMKPLPAGSFCLAFGIALMAQVPDKKAY